VFPWRDWGNHQVVEIAKRVKSWPAIANIETADGYFKAIIRPHEEEGREWFWALEWNRSYRVIGGIYRDDTVPPIFADLPELNWNQVAHSKRMRKQIPLPDDEDTLFRD
jgi:hypothetical protein